MKKDKLLPTIYILTFLFRLLFATHIGLIDDEAYHWSWSKELQFSYFDHPGMIAWCEWLTTRLFGDTYIGVRLPAMIFYGLTAFFLWKLTKELFDKTAAHMTTLIFLWSPFYGFGGHVASPEPPFIFFRGEVDKYTWVDLGSSFLPSDLNAAVLWAQLESLEIIQNKRLEIWNNYHKALKVLQEKEVLLPIIKENVQHNAHTYYLVCKSLDQRSRLMTFLKEKGVQTTFHYISLHTSPFFKEKHDGRILKNADRFTDQLVRLPLYPDLSSSDQEYIIENILKFFKQED